MDGCGTGTWSDLAYIDASPGIDLVSYHQYDGMGAMSASDVSSWKTLTTEDAKPLFAGENGGVNATASGSSAASGCTSQAARSSGYQQEITSDFADLPSMAGWLFWNAMPGPGSTCDYSTFVGDPLLPMLREEGAQLNAG